MCYVKSSNAGKRKVGHAVSGNKCGPDKGKFQAPVFIVGRVDKAKKNYWSAVLHMSLKWANTSHFSPKSASKSQIYPTEPFKKLFWLFSHSRPLGERTIDGSGDYKWRDLNGYRLEYIQDGLLVPFGPSVIAIRGSWGLELA